MKNRQSIIISASWVAFAINLLLSLIKISAGLISGSLALLADGFDSVTDSVTAALTVFAAHVSVKPPDKTHPYGHSRAETVTSAVLAFLIVFAGAQLGIMATNKILAKSFVTPSLVAIYAAAFSLVSKLGLAIYLARVGKQNNSQMHSAYSKNMLADTLTSGSVLLGILLIYITGYQIIDPILSVIISIIIIRSGVYLFTETNIELMEGIKDTSIYKTIMDAVKEVPKAYNPHKIRVRKLGNMFIIELDIEVEGSTSVNNAHSIAKQVENNIKNKMTNIYDVNIHIEPRGNIEEEVFGVSEHSDKD